VTKRKVSFALILMLVVAGLIVAMLPAAAVAASGIVEVNWSEAAFEGNDAFYGGVAVVAYEAGSTAKLEFRVWNDSAVDIDVTGGNLTFDWGSCSPTSPTTFPFVLKAGDRAVFRFECVVPADATNQALHTYKAVVRYEGVNGPTVVNSVSYEDVPGGGVTYTVLHGPIVPDSEVIYYEDTAANTVTTLALNSGYAINDYSGVITFSVAPTLNVRATYKYTEAVFAGNGVNKVGYLAHAPVVAGSEIVCLVDTLAETIATQASSAYIIDNDTGKITMATAPSAWQSVNVYYKYCGSFTNSGTNLAVYSADQADAQALAAQWTNMNAASVPPVFWLPLTTTAGAQPLSDSKVLAAQAATKYAAGDFAGAKADYQSAVDGLNTAYTANAALNTTAETGLASLLTNAGGAVDSYGAKLDAEAGKAHLIGVFYIMLGVALLIASLGSILWAYSLLVVARGPRQL
jgi:hypothetical protein